ncbi:MAG: CDGSH iron-sulfur domain-containing protein [Candidatus Micrarchaeia archaeon]
MVENMEIKIKSAKNGPNLVTVDGAVKFALCRCGHSKKKPFCDGTHHKVNFEAEEHEMTVE